MATGVRGINSGWAMRLLLVDQETPAYETLIASLTHAGYDVTRAGDVDAGWTAYSVAPFPAVLVPCASPHDAALALIRRIRDHRDGRATAIVAGVNGHDAETIASIVHAGVDDFAQLPWEPNALVARLALATSRGHARWVERASDDALFAGLADLLPDGIVAFDRAGTIAIANRQAETMFGYAAGSLVGRSVGDLVADATDRADLMFEATLLGERARNGVAVTGKRDNGAPFPIELRLSSGAVGGRSLAIASIRDVAEQRRTEAALSASEQRLRVALAAAKMGTWDWDLTNGELIWSNETEQIAGVDYGGTHTIDTLINILHPDD
ncbi:MAG: PAS domain S-box protein, partial [Thermomicrobiales bacterium]|nr:PAS domain S-box protein [Thermomicrobiales bacterium]